MPLNLVDLASEEKIIKGARTIIDESLPGWDHSYGVSRSLLFDSQYATELTTYGLDRALEKVSKVLGKKLDLIGFDACLMSSIEIAYQAAEYADFMVGAEEGSCPREGWNYKRISEFLSANPSSSAEALASEIVKAYHLRHSSGEKDYTQTATRLDKVSKVKELIDKVLVSGLFLQVIDLQFVESALKRARIQAMLKAKSELVDLYTFVHVLILYFSEVPEQVKTDRWKTLARLLHELLGAINECVFEHVATGGYKDKIKGLSIYMPLNCILPLYKKCKFATDSNWLAFIKRTNIFLN